VVVIVPQLMHSAPSSTSRLDRSHSLGLTDSPITVCTLLVIVLTILDLHFEYMQWTLHTDL
jgi:hypothetical protein